MKKTYAAFVIIGTTYLLNIEATLGQQLKVQQGILNEFGSGSRISQVKISNKRTRAVTMSTLQGVFNITAESGDTLLFTSPNHQTKEFVVSDFKDAVIALDKVITLSEVSIKETTRASDLKEAQLGYRKKGVFYTGTPHYYYLFLKPMTFIYENFKSEVINARKFNKIVQRETEATEVLNRWTDVFITKVLNIKGEELTEFKARYMPTVQQIRSMNDYDLTLHVKRSYAEYEKSSKNN